MRVLARIGCTLAGMALMAPAAAWAGQPTDSSPAGAPAKHKHHRSLFGRERLCAECQRAQAQAKTGVMIPPAPPLPGPVSSGGECAACGGNVAVAHTGHIPLPASAPANMMVAGANTGYAVAGGDVGYATVDGGPTPVGMVEPRVAASGMGAMRMPASAGLKDAAIAASSYSPSVVKPHEANSPHVISHMLGISGIGRERRESRERRKEEAHASIPYGQQNATVTDVPARVVYGRR